jgi:hypothetical protein
MNMILDDFPTANILSGNTLAAPKFKWRATPYVRFPFFDEPARLSRTAAPRAWF